jgi:hypothetical protein
VSPDHAIAFHHFLVHHSQEVCPLDESRIDCAHCSVRRICAFYQASADRRRKRAPSKNSRSVPTRTPKRPSHASDRAATNGRRAAIRKSASSGSTARSSSSSRAAGSKSLRLRTLGTKAKSRGGSVR